jgi:toxin ParE1/3/4
VSRYVLSPAAQADLDDIWDYGEATWGAAQAETYIRSLQQAVETIAADPRRGRDCAEVRAGYFKFAVGVHMLFYQRTVDGVAVMRILHQRMDFDRHL